jgi:hypothetical protein
MENSIFIVDLRITSGDINSCVSLPEGMLLVFVTFAYLQQQKLCAWT